MTKKKEKDATGASEAATPAKRMPITEVPLSAAELSNLDLWAPAPVAALMLDKSLKYVNILATQYKRIRTQKLGPHLMLYYKPDLEAYKANPGKPGRPPTKERGEGSAPVKRVPGRPRKVVEDAA